MAEIIDAPPVESNTVDTAKQELAQNMAIALGGGIIPQEQKQDTPPVDTPPVDTPPTDTPPALTFETLKEKFAYEKPEDAIKEIEEYRKFKENPIAEVGFENEQSEKIFKALQSGKPEDIKLVAKFLAEQERLDNFVSTEITKDNAADIIKLGMHLKYKDLTPQEIDYKFKKQFALPKEPIQALEENDDAFADRQKEWKAQVEDIEMDKILEAKFIRPELEAHKTKLVLPEIAAQIDEDYLNYKKEKEETPLLIAEIEEAYKSFTPKSIETKINFNDEANKIAFEFHYEPSADDFKKAVELAKSPTNFYKFFLNQDGTPDRTRFLRAVEYAVNPEKVIMEAMKQAKNATLKSQLPDNSGNGNRQLPQGQQVSELDAYMRQAGILS